MSLWRGRGMEAGARAIGFQAEVRTGQIGPQTERLESGAAGEAGGREDSGGVRGWRAHGPGGVQARSESRRRREKRFRIGNVGDWHLRQVLIVRVYGVAIEQRADAVAVKSALRRRRVCLCGSQGGDEQKQTGEMASAQSHGCL